MSNLDIITLDHYELKREPVGRVIYFEATVADIVQVSPATRWDPAEYGSAACTGELLLGDDEPTPENCDEYMRYAEQVDTWQPITDLY
tara:strand:- start:449 stop:712 length:264 start_codon:yes stop_codon:yes gene_type:complete